MRTTARTVAALLALAALTPAVSAAEKPEAGPKKKSKAAEGIGKWGYRGGMTVERMKTEVAGTALDAVYLSERYGLTDYVVQLPKGTYRVTLHFAETYEGITAEGERVYDVRIEGQKALEKFDPYKEAGKKRFKAVTRAFDVEVADGDLVVGFTARVQEPMINGIEVVGSKKGKGGKPLSLRIDCGGYKEWKSPEGEAWKPDRIYDGPKPKVPEKAKVTAVGAGKDLEVGKWGYVGGMTVERMKTDVGGTKDDRIYLTERYGLDSYVARVPDGKYKVTLHFAETYEDITSAGERVFAVSLNGKDVLKKFDPFAEAGKKTFQAVEKTFPVTVKGGVLVIGFSEGVQNPLINGIEIVGECGAAMRINCGGYKKYTDSRGNVWHPDRYYDGPKPKLAKDAK